MKRLLVCACLFFLSLTSAALLHVSGADKIIDVDFTTYFDEGNQPFVRIRDLAYGERLSFADDIAVGEGEYAHYQFAYWIVNGKIRADLDINHEFVIRNRMTIKALFSPDDAHLAVFMDANEDEIAIEYVADGGNAVGPALESLPDKPNFVVANPAWDEPLTNITENTVFVLQYVLDDEGLEFDLTVEGGSGGGTFAYNEVVTVEAGEGNFSYWRIGNRIVSYQEEYSFTLLDDMTITAVFDEGEPKDDEPYIALSYPYELRLNHHSYVGQFFIPEGYELIEYGLLASGVVPIVHFPFEPFPYVGDGIELYQGAKFMGTTNEFLMTLPEEDSHYARAYLIVKDDQNELQAYYDAFHREAECPNSIYAKDYPSDTPVTVTGVVAATTDEGYILQDPLTARMISVHHGDSVFVHGDEVVVSGTFNISYGIASIINPDYWLLVSSDNAINYDTSHAVTPDYDNYDIADLMGELVRIEAPFLRLMGDFAHSYWRIFHNGQSTQLYDGKYIGLRNDATNANLTGSLADIFVGGKEATVYPQVTVYYFFYDSELSYHKAVIIGDDHIVVDEEPGPEDHGDEVISVDFTNAGGGEGWWTIEDENYFAMIMNGVIDDEIVRFKHSDDSGHVHEGVSGIIAVSDLVITQSVVTMVIEIEVEGDSDDATITVLAMEEESEEPETLGPDPLAETNGDATLTYIFDNSGIFIDTLYIFIDMPNPGMTVTISGVTVYEKD